MKVKITGCSDENFWYKNEIENEFEVTEGLNHYYTGLHNDEPIIKSDCKVLPEIPPELNKDVDIITILKKAAELILGREIFLPQVLIIKDFIKNRWNKPEIPSNGGEGESEKMVEDFILSHRHNIYLKLDKDADRDKIKMLIDIITESWSSQPTKEFSRSTFEELTEELWDKHSEYIDDNADSFSRVAGSSVLQERDYKKLTQQLFEKIKFQPEGFSKEQMISFSKVVAGKIVTDIKIAIKDTSKAGDFSEPNYSEMLDIFLTEINK